VRDAQQRERAHEPRERTLQFTRTRVSAMREYGRAHGERAVGRTRGRRVEEERLEPRTHGVRTHGKQQE
jgi:hypothetical protein